MIFIIFTKAYQMVNCFNVLLLIVANNKYSFKKFDNSILLFFSDQKFEHLGLNILFKKN
jgi:hypothetical protein